MKTLQQNTKINLVIIFLLLLGVKSQATDLIVAPGGAGGAYSSIGAAVTASASGDRIIVYPNSGGSSYSEGTITITKSLQILSANEGAYYSVDGSITITPATAGITVTIAEMKLFTGNISAGGSAPTGSRSVVNLLNDSIAQGFINFNYNNWNLTLANSYLYSYVYLNYGRVIGNTISTGSGYAIQFNTDASTNNPNDTDRKSVV